MTVENTEPRELEQDIEALRNELDELVDELDRRRHDALDWRLQLRRHRRPLGIAASAVVLTVGIVVVRSRRRERTAHARALLRALRLVAQNPDALSRAVEQQRPASRIPGVAAKLVTSALPPLARGLLRDAQD